jgi:hypothetical protein
MEPQNILYNEGYKIKLKVKELPHQTFSRCMGLPWPGGKSKQVDILLRHYRIIHTPGSAEANLSLQRALLAEEVLSNPNHGGITVWVTEAGVVLDIYETKS